MLAAPWHDDQYTSRRRKYLLKVNNVGVELLLLAGHCVCRLWLVDYDWQLSDTADGTCRHGYHKVLCMAELPMQV